MLQNNLELIIQYPARNSYICRGFKGLHLHAPVFVVFEGATTNDQKLANLLGITFCHEVMRLAGTTEEHQMPCGGQLGVVNCHAIDEPTCKKILVQPAGNQAIPNNWPNAPTVEHRWQQKINDPLYSVVQVVPSSHPSSSLRFPAINACLWKSHPIESILAILQQAGIGHKENQVFISYVRKDSAAIADQLFQALTNEGFDVFLDRCSVPVGVQFQEHLMQDICDKAMVVLLNTDGVKNSHWVGEEIAIVKTYRLGLLEVLFPNVLKRKDIDPDFTEEITSADLLSAGSGYSTGHPPLTTGKLTNIIERIKIEHGRALHRRRIELINNLAVALTNAGKSSQILPDGTFLVRPSRYGTEKIIALTSRTPTLGDFSLLHQQGKVSPIREGVIVSPAPLFQAHRLNQISWLGGVSNIQHINEAQLNALAASI